MECLPSPWPRKGTGLLPAPVKVRQFSVSGVCSAPFHCLHQNNIALSPAAPWEEGFIVLFLCGGWGRMGAGGRYKAIPHNSKCRYGGCGTASALPKCSINVGLRYPHRASGAKAPRTLRPLPLLRFAVSATGGAHLCSIQYYLRFWLSICRTSLAVSALRIMRYCLNFSKVKSM